MMKRRGYIQLSTNETKVNFLDISKYTLARCRNSVYSVWEL